MKEEEKKEGKQKEVMTYYENPQSILEKYKYKKKHYNISVQISSTE